MVENQSENELALLASVANHAPYIAAAHGRADDLGSLPTAINVLNPYVDTPVTSHIKEHQHSVNPASLAFILNPVNDSLPLAPFPPMATNGVPGQASGPTLVVQPRWPFPAEGQRLGHTGLVHPQPQPLRAPLADAFHAPGFAANDRAENNNAVRVGEPVNLADRISIQHLTEESNYQCGTKHPRYPCTDDAEPQPFKKRRMSGELTKTYVSSHSYPLAHTNVTRLLAPAPAQINLVLEPALLAQGSGTLNIEAVTAVPRLKHDIGGWAAHVSAKHEPAVLQRFTEGYASLLEATQQVHVSEPVTGADSDVVVTTVMQNGHGLAYRPSTTSIAEPPLAGHVAGEVENEAESVTDSITITFSPESLPETDRLLSDVALALYAVWVESDLASSRALYAKEKAQAVWFAHLHERGTAGPSVQAVMAWMSAKARYEEARDNANRSYDRYLAASP